MQSINVQWQAEAGGSRQILADNAKLMDCEFQPVSTNYVNDRVEKQRDQNVKAAIEADVVLAQVRKGTLPRNSQTSIQANEQLDRISTAIAGDPYSKFRIPSKGLIDDIEARAQRQQQMRDPKQINQDPGLTC